MEAGLHGECQTTSSVTTSNLRKRVSFVQLYMCASVCSFVWRCVCVMSVSVRVYCVFWSICLSLYWLCVSFFVCVEVHIQCIYVLFNFISPSCVYWIQIVSSCRKTRKRISFLTCTHMYTNPVGINICISITLCESVLSPLPPGLLLCLYNVSQIKN